MSEKKDRYAELFLALSQKVESWIVRAIGWLLLLLIIFQILLLFPKIRLLISEVVRLEGTVASLFATMNNL